MIITLSAPAGGGKTKAALDIGCALGLECGQKVVYLTKDSDYNGWKSYVKEKVGDYKAVGFRPLSVDSLHTALQILPYVDHLPYGIIILDGFGSELEALSAVEYNELTKSLLEYTPNKEGKVIITMLQD